MVSTKAVIFGIEGPSLSEKEIDFFKSVKPVGFILFARNCLNPNQLKNLISELKITVHDGDVLILIDQEGGRVARLGPPNWPKRPSASIFARLAEENVALACEALDLNARLMAQDLRALGINVNCAPVLDIFQRESDPIIGDRSFGHNVEQVSVLGKVFCKSLLKGGILPVIKHIPGHGRAIVDSHKAMPLVDTPWNELSNSDFVPFKNLSDMPFAMTAHILYRDIDPKNLVTVSVKVIEEVIRKEILFKGFLITDDLSMNALEGTLTERTRSSLTAGCDAVLHCNGNMEEMIEIASAVGELTNVAKLRLNRALMQIKNVAPFDKTEAMDKLESLGIY